MKKEEIDKLIGLTLEEAKKIIPEEYLICPYCIEGTFYMKKQKSFKVN